MRIGFQLIAFASSLVLGQDFIQSMKCGFCFLVPFGVCTFYKFNLLNCQLRKYFMILITFLTRWRFKDNLVFKLLSSWDSMSSSQRGPHVSWWVSFVVWVLQRRLSHTAQCTHNLKWSTTQTLESVSYSSACSHTHTHTCRRRLQATVSVFFEFLSTILIPKSAFPTFEKIGSSAGIFGLES